MSKDLETPVVFLNGQQLTPGQVITLQVALGSFTMDLQTNGLGDDDHGKTMTRLYLENINDLLRILKG